MSWTRISARTGTLLGGLITTGCAFLFNMDRPKPAGPVVPPAWHNATIRVEQPPLVYQGKVFVMARPWADRDYPRVYAFDLHTGAPLWSTDFSARRIVLAAGSRLFVKDSGGRDQLIDLDTGRVTPAPMRLSIAHATSANGVLYAVGVTGAVQAWPLTMDQPLWTSEMAPYELGHSEDKLQRQWGYREPFVPPVLAGGTLYTSGQSKFDLATRSPAYASVHAFDASNGKERWKWELKDKAEVFSIHAVAADAQSAYVWLYDRSTVFTKEKLIALDAATGKEKWRRESPTFPPAFLHAALVDNAVLTCEYPGPPDGNADKSGLLFLALSRINGNVLWQSRTAWKYKAAILAGDVLAVSDSKVHEVLTENNNTSPDSWVSVISIRSGKELWRSTEVELGVFTAPAAGDGMVVVGSKPFVWDAQRIAGKREVAGLYAWRLRQE